jgi:hypothetical protein
MLGYGREQKCDLLEGTEGLDLNKDFPEARYQEALWGTDSIRNLLFR